MTDQTKVLIGVGAATLAIFVGGLLLFGGNTQAPPGDTSALVRADSIQTGPANAKVTVVEFGDIQCPACAAAAPTFKRLKDEYKDRVNFVFRHYPLPFHSNAQAGAQAAEAAHQQGKFWEMYDKLYAGQKEWEASTNANETFIRYAKELGLDEAKFKDDLENFRQIDHIRADKADGDALGVNATPTFFINGAKYPGVIGYNEFKSLIDQQL
jgi:protein-disulfide isomerase